MTKQFRLLSIRHECNPNLLLLFLAVLEPRSNVLIQNIRKYPHMHDEEYAQTRFGKAVGFGPLVLPFVMDEARRIIYTIIEYDPLLDSSNMTIKDWVTNRAYAFLNPFHINELNLFSDFLPRYK